MDMKSRWLELPVAEVVPSNIERSSGLVSGIDLCMHHMRGRQRSRNYIMNVGGKRFE
jgi:hypothetical protein